MQHFFIYYNQHHKIIKEMSAVRSCIYIPVSVFVQQYGVSHAVEPQQQTRIFIECVDAMFMDSHVLHVHLMKTV